MKMTLIPQENHIKQQKMQTELYLKKKHKKLRKYGELNQRYKITELLSCDKNLCLNMTLL